MTFVSYAQNFEDVVLWRALHDVQGGRYIDIGAQEPEFDSVSLAFYKAGWRGIHVEPTPLYAARLRDARPDETVIEAAVADVPGPIPFFELGGLSSGRQEVADHHRRSGHEPRTILVPTVRLEHLLDLNDADVHWLKIDVEGMEADVLRSWGQSAKRPWVLVIESTFPNSEAATEHLWIDQVLARGYREVFFDGLSRYFVHELHSDIAKRLNRPANVFDAFQITSQHFSAALTRDEAEAQAKRSEARIAALSLDILQVRERFHTREAELAAERVKRAGEEQELRAAIRSAEGEVALERAKRAEEEQELRAAIRSAEGEVAVERAKIRQLEEGQRQLSIEVDALNEQARSERQARAELNAELVKISGLVGNDLNEFGQLPGKDQWLPVGTTYAAVKSRLVLARDELHEARHFAIQQFTAGQKSRDPEVMFLGERISALQNEVVEARNRISETEVRAGQDRAHLQSVIDQQVDDLASIRSERGQLDRQLSEARQLVSSIYESRRGKLASWLKLVPRPPRRIGPPVKADPVPAALVDQKLEQTSSMAQQSGMDISVNDIRHTSNLLSLHGSAFVDALYRTLLKRSADRAGRSHFIARLQAGDPKEEILLAVATSPEARTAGANIEGLADLERAHARARRWSFFSRNRRARAFEGRLNRLEYTIGEAHNSLVNRLERMESSLDQIQAKLEGSGPARQLVQSRQAGVYVQGVPVSIKRGMSLRPSNGAAEFIDQLRESVQSSMEALSLRNGR